MLPRTRIANIDMDELGSEGTPIAAEGKACVRGAKLAIIQAMAQLHGDLTLLESTFTSRPAHFVVFRLGGPPYDLPAEIETNRCVLHTHIIDLAPSRESESRQPTPIAISREEILTAMNVEEDRINP